MLIPSVLTTWLCSAQLYAPVSLRLDSLCSDAAPHESSAFFKLNSGGNLHHIGGSTGAGEPSTAAHSTSASRSTFSPLLPPAIPLAVKTPYLNAWLSAGGEHGNGGYLAGAWAKHWPVAYGPTAKQFELGWTGLIRIDDET